MLFKLFLISALIFLTTDAGKTETNDESVSFSVENVWLSYKNENKKCMCSPDDGKWIDGVQDYYTGCKEVTRDFCGSSYKIADNVMTSFESYLKKLIYFANTNSTVLASSSTVMLGSLSKCSRLKSSCLVIISEFEKVLAGLVKDFNRVVVTKLWNFAGDVVYPYNDAVVNVSDAFFNFMKAYLKCSSAECKKKVDYVPLFRASQKLMNTAALIAETLVNECDSPTREHYETVTIFNMIFCYFAIAVQGVNSCVQNQLYQDELAVSKDIESVSTSFDFVVVGASEALFSVVYPFDKTIGEMLTTFVDITIAFNKAVKDILGVFEGATITRGEIKSNLKKCVEDCGPEAGDRINVAKGIIR